MNSYSFFTITTYVTLVVVFNNCMYGQTITQEVTAETIRIDTARNLNLHDITQALYAHDPKKVELLVADYIPTHEELEKYYSLALKQLDAREQLLKTSSTLKWTGIVMGAVTAALAFDIYLIKHDRQTLRQKEINGDTKSTSTISPYNTPLWTMIAATAGCIKVFFEFRRYRQRREQRRYAYECLRVIERTRTLSLKN